MTEETGDFGNETCDRTQWLPRKPLGPGVQAKAYKGEGQWETFTPVIETSDLGTPYIRTPSGELYWWLPQVGGWYQSGYYLLKT